MQYLFKIWKRIFRKTDAFYQIRIKKRLQLQKNDIR